MLVEDSKHVRLTDICGFVCVRVCVFRSDHLRSFVHQKQSASCQDRGFTVFVSHEFRFYTRDYIAYKKKSLWKTHITWAELIKHHEMLL